MKESKAMVKREVEFFKKKGAPADMQRHEKQELRSMSVPKKQMPKKK
jgi:hypothetical protein